ncbi:MAG: sulfite exporter TauE/SafE family protein [Desulfobacterales bacterium]|nr:sulfite exporter TauE/SafE family protein [Desulfobacterales bacterium]
MFIDTVSYPAAFIAGLISFFSPCILPLVPAYFTFITGFSIQDLTEGITAKIRRDVIISTISYVLGFSFIFILMGATASFLGGFFIKYKDIIRIAGGVLIIIFGVHLTGLLRIRSLDFEKRVHVKKAPINFLGGFFVGMAFGAGWSPCVGPLLGSILSIAAMHETVTKGIILLGVYSLGMALPFIIISIFINFILVFIKRIMPIMQKINFIAGSLLIFIGVLLIFNKLYLF